MDPELAADVDRLREEWLAAKRKGLGITGRAQWHEGTKWDIGDPWQFAPPSDEQLIESARIMNLPKALAKCAARGSLAFRHGVGPSCRSVSSSLIVIRPLWQLAPINEDQLLDRACTISLTQSKRTLWNLPYPLNSLCEH